MQFVLRFLNPLIFCSFFCVVEAQDPNLPDGRTSGILTYHPPSKSMLLIDGYQIHPENNQNRVWSWDGKQWKQLEATGPVTKSLSSATLNTKTNEILVFGGIGKNGYESKTGDTWIFDGSQWKEVKTNDIGTRDHHRIVYADHLDAYVLYGGTMENRVNDTQTWLLKNGKFTSLSIPGPGQRFHFGMAYDRSRKIVVLYGGGPQNQHELWEFDGKAWEKIVTSINPGPRIWLNMVYDEHHKRIVIHGGRDKTDTWSWDGKQWNLLTQNGPNTILPALGYDPISQTIFLYGGDEPGNKLSSTLWQFKDDQWIEITNNGKWQFKEGKRQYIPPPPTTEQIMQEVSKGRQYVLVFFKKGQTPANNTTEMQSLQMEHLKFLFNLKTEGKISVFGPFLEGGELEGFAIFNETDFDKVKTIMETEPFMQRGMMKYDMVKWFGLPGTVLPE